MPRTDLIFVTNATSRFTEHGNRLRGILRAEFKIDVVFRRHVVEDSHMRLCIMFEDAADLVAFKLKYGHEFGGGVTLLRNDDSLYGDKYGILI